MTPNTRAQRRWVCLEGFLDNKGLPVGLRVLTSPVIAFGNGRAGVHPEALKYSEKRSICYFLYPGDVAPSKTAVLNTILENVQILGHHIATQLQSQLASLMLLYV